MAIETVQIKVVDDSIEAAPINGALLRVFDDEGNFISTATSGEAISGSAFVELPGSADGEVYELRFFKVAARIKPQRIVVYSPPAAAPLGINIFEVYGTTFRLVPSPDPRMCRISGSLANAAGFLRRGVDLIISPRFNAFIHEESVVTTGRVLARTDADGYVSFDLFRSAMYDITVEGQEETTRTVQVPDRAALSLTSLLFPVVSLVEFVEAGPEYTVSVGGALTLTPKITATDYRVLDGTGTEDVGYTVDDQSVASLYILGDRIEVRGIAAGTTTLRLFRLDDSVVSLPDPGIVGGRVTIHVV